MRFRLSSGVFCPLIEDSNGLAFAPREGLRGRQLDGHGQVEGVLERFEDAILKCRVGSGFHRDVFRRFYPYAQVVLMVRAGTEHNLVVGFEPVDAEQGVLDLRGENVDPTYDEHIVRAADDPRDAGTGPSTGAWLPGESGKVPGAVPENRERLLCRCGQDQLTDLPIRQALAGLGVHYLRYEMVLP